jgi:hypothetical protein
VAFVEKEFPPSGIDWSLVATQMGIGNTMKAEGESDAGQLSLSVTTSTVVSRWHLQSAVNISLVQRTPMTPSI